jgi:hypothetical protein
MWFLWLNFDVLLAVSVPPNNSSRKQANGKNLRSSTMLREETPARQNAISLNFAAQTARGAE